MSRTQLQTRQSEIGEGRVGDMPATRTGTPNALIRAPGVPLPPKQITLGSKRRRFMPASNLQSIISAPPVPSAVIMKTVRIGSLRRTAPFSLTPLVTPPRDNWQRPC